MISDLGMDIEVIPKREREKQNEPTMSNVQTMSKEGAKIVPRFKHKLCRMLSCGVLVLVMAHLVYLFDLHRPEHMLLPQEAVSQSVHGKENETTTSTSIFEESKEKSKETILMPDEVFPVAVHAETHFLKSIPSTFRFPWVDQNNATSYFRETVNEPKKYLWEYNPALVYLPEDQVPDIDQLQDARIQKDSLYLALYRVSNVQSCLTTEFCLEHNLTFGWGKRHVEMTAFAILNADFEILAETIVGIGRDYRLYNLRGQLYLSKDTLIWPIWINKKATPPNVRTATLRSSFSSEHFSVYRGVNAACVQSQFRKGKNFNYFEDASGRVMAQIYPMGPRIVENVNISVVCGRETLHQEPRNESSSAAQLEQASLFETRSLPNATFKSYDETYFPKFSRWYPFTEERGTACCLSLPDKRNDVGKFPYLLVGISHTKIPFWVKLRNASFTSRQYTNRLYAFEPVPPYRLVARSGGFCLGFPDHDEGLDNPNVWFLRNKSYSVGRPLNCPHITFVMSIIDAVHDPFMAIITYGMNDCASRMMKVRKSDLSQLLFPPP